MMINNEELKLALRREKAKYIFENQFFFWGIAGTTEFTLIRAESLHDNAEHFPISSAGILLATLDPKGKIAILLVNEEENRWDISSGKVEPEDENCKLTALREFNEETKIKLYPNEVFPLTLCNKSKKENRRYSVLCCGGYSRKFSRFTN